MQSVCALLKMLLMVKAGRNVREQTQLDHIISSFTRFIWIRNACSFLSLRPQTTDWRLTSSRMRLKSIISTYNRFRRQLQVGLWWECLIETWRPSPLHFISFRRFEVGRKRWRSWISEYMQLVFNMPSCRCNESLRAGLVRQWHRSRREIQN